MIPVDITLIVGVDEAAGASCATAGDIAPTAISTPAATLAPSTLVRVATECPMCATLPARAESSPLIA